MQKMKKSLEILLITEWNLQKNPNFKVNMNPSVNRFFLPFSVRIFDVTEFDQQLDWKLFQH